MSLCLLTVAGTSFITDKIGFSDTLGAFLAGVLLAESNYRQQVEVDIKPYKGILLGLFFLVSAAGQDNYDTRFFVPRETTATTCVGAWSLGPRFG